MGKKKSTGTCCGILLDLDMFNFYTIEFKDFLSVFTHEEKESGHIHCIICDKYAFQFFI